MLLLNIKNAKSVLKDIDFKKGIKKVDKIVDADGSLEERVRAYERYGSNNKWHVRNKTKVINIKSGNYIELGTNVFKWGNSKSKKTYGHTFLDHSVTVDSQKLFNRARVKKQVGQWLDDKAAAKFLADFARDNKPGIYLHVPMPEDVPGRVFLKDGTIINNPDNVVIIIRKDGSIKTAYPQSIKYAY